MARHYTIHQKPYVTVIRYVTYGMLITSDPEFIAVQFYSVKALIVVWVELYDPITLFRMLEFAQCLKKSSAHKDIQIDVMLRSGFFRETCSVTVPRFGFFLGFADKGIPHLLWLSLDNVAKNGSMSPWTELTAHSVTYFSIMPNRILRKSFVKTRWSTSSHWFWHFRLKHELSKISFKVKMTSVLLSLISAFGSFPDGLDY